jgi:hypothetical protein
LHNTQVAIPRTGPGKDSKRKRFQARGVEEGGHVSHRAK